MPLNVPKVFKPTYWPNVLYSAGIFNIQGTKSISGEEASETGADPMKFFRVSVIMIKILKDILEVKKSQSRVHIEIIISQLSSLLCRERPLMPLILFYPSGFRRWDAFYKFSHTLAIFTLGQKHIFNIFQSTFDSSGRTNGNCF